MRLRKNPAVISPGEYSISQIAELYDVSTQAIHYRVQDDNLPPGMTAKRIGGRWLIIVAPNNEQEVHG